jgi:hypothetical protein
MEPIKTYFKASCLDPPTLAPISRPDSTAIVPEDPLSLELLSSQEKYAFANSQSLKAYEEACNYFPGGNTRTVLHSSPFPITFGQHSLPIYKFCTLTT